MFSINYFPQKQEEILMNFYDTVSKYVEYDTMDKKDKNVHEMEYVREKRRYYEKKIKDEINEVLDIKLLKKILVDFKYILTAKEEFMIYNRYFFLEKNDKDMLLNFIDVMYFWGPDYDDEIKKINKLIAEKKYQTASDICMNIKY